MIRIYLLALLLIVSLFQGCKQPASDDKIEDTGMNVQLNEECDYMLTKDEAKQALLTLFVNRDKKDAEERDFRDYFEGYPDGKFNYNYEDYVVIETIRKWPPEGIEVDDIVEEDDVEIIDEWECNLKEGLFRRINNQGSTFGRFRKNKHGEWITTIEGRSWAGSYGGRGQ